MRWHLIHQIEWCIVEHVTVGLVLDDFVEGSIARHDDGDGAFDDRGAVVVCEVVAIAQGLELRVGVGPDIFAIVFKVDEEYKGLTGFGVKDSVAREFGRGMKCRDGVCLVEDLQQRVDVEAAEGAGRC